MEPQPGPPGASDVPGQSMLIYEFVFYLLPCLVFLAAAARRYLLLRDIPALDDPPPETDSMRLKVVLSECQTVLYLLQFVMGLIAAPSLFFASGFRNYSFCYLLGAAAWHSSTRLLQMEWQRGLDQSIWCHRLFWPLSNTFQIMHLLEEYQLTPLNLAFNLLELLPLSVLSMYALFKPTDHRL
jgi:hypothetical protein